MVLTAEKAAFHYFQFLLLATFAFYAYQASDAKVKTLDCLNKKKPRNINFLLYNLDG